MLANATRLVSQSRRCFSTQTLKHRNILISNALGDQVPKAAIAFLEQEGANIDFMPRNLDKDTRTPQLLTQVQSKEYDALFVCLDDIVNSELINASQPSVRMISTLSVGTNHIDVNECKKHKIRIGFTPEILTETTADLVLTLTLATARKVVIANHAVYSGEWGPWNPLWMAGKDVYGSTIGIVGFGRIGSAVAKRFSGFGCNIIYCNSSGKPSKLAEEMGAKYVSISEVLSESDFVIPLCPLTADTKHLFKYDSFVKMKKDAIFINASRGDIVDQDALVDALRNKEIYAAGLDVTTPEPLPLDHALLSLDNCTILPHIGSASERTRTQMALQCARNISDVFEGKESKFLYL